MAGVVPMPGKTSRRKQWTLHGKLFVNVPFVVVVLKDVVPVRRLQTYG
jgi:hypothetical protein